MSSEPTTADDDVDELDDESEAEPSVENLANQSWPSASDKSETIEHEFMDGTNVEARVQDPDTETIIEFAMGGMGVGGEDKSQSQSQFDLCRAAIIEPELTIEDWRGFREADRLLLTDKVTEAIGLDRVMGFQDGGLEQQLEELVPE